MPLDMLITGRIATLAGDTGFGWVEEPVNTPRDHPVGVPVRLITAHRDRPLVDSMRLVVAGKEARVLGA